MRVIITGAAGQIGREMIDALSDSHELRLLDRFRVPARASYVADLASCRLRTRWQRGLWFARPRWIKAFEGADIVLHLAAEPSPNAAWHQVLRDNIEATWNVLTVASHLGINRVVYASSIFAIKALERELAPACYASGGPKIGSDAPPRPLTAYGVSKAVGEQIGRMFVDEGRLASFIAVRLGHYQPVSPEDGELRHLWIGTRDLRGLLRRCVEANVEGFHVVYGTSAQPTSPFDLSHTRRLLSWEPRQLP